MSKLKLFFLLLCLMESPFLVTIKAETNVQELYRTASASNCVLHETSYYALNMYATLQIDNLKKIKQCIQDEFPDGENQIFSSGKIDKFMQVRRNLILGELEEDVGESVCDKDRIFWFESFGKENDVRGILVWSPNVGVIRKISKSSRPVHQPYHDMFPDIAAKEMIVKNEKIASFKRFSEECAGKVDCPTDVVLKNCSQLEGALYPTSYYDLQMCLVKTFPGLRPSSVICQEVCRVSGGEAWLSRFSRKCTTWLKTHIELIDKMHAASSQTDFWFWHVYVVDGIENRDVVLLSWNGEEKCRAKHFLERTGVYAKGTIKGQTP